MPTNKPFLGIDLRVNSVKVVEIEPAKTGSPILKAWGLTEIPYNLVDKHPQKEDAQAEALRKLIQTRKMKAKDAAVVVGGNDVFVRLFTLAEVSRAELAEVIKWKFAEEVPFPVEEAIIDFYPLPRSATAFSEKKEYIAACINVKLFKEIDYIIRKAGLNLSALNILPDCLHTVFEHELHKHHDKIVSLMYMGKRTTNITILKDENIEFNRELSIGGENITLAMSGVLVSADGRVEISPEEAEKIKVEHGIPLDLEKYPKFSEIPVSQLQAMVRPALERVQDEIMRTFEYYKGQTGEAAIDKILITGGSSLTINLVDFLAQGLGVPVETPNAMEGGRIDEKIEDRPTFDRALPRLTAAIGAAMVGATKINLLPEERKYRWKTFTKKFVKPQYIVPVFTALLLLVYGVFWLQAALLTSEISTVNNKMSRYKPRIATLDIIEKATQEKERRKAVVESYAEKRTKMPAIFRELSRLIPQSVFVNVLNLTPSELHLWGTAIGKYDTAENILSQFVIALSTSDYFQEIRLIQAIKNYDYIDDAFNFEIVAEIKI
ncbi:MAG: pilus assembly protein PilM [Candidatus Saganbacteria bacterium]|nr:pilus assembly protein PilM [Candidatus Saganbacteria bacterium]